MPDAARKTPDAMSPSGVAPRAPLVAGSEPERGDGSIGLGQVWNAVLRSKLTVLACTLLGAGTGSLLAMQVTDRYVAETTLLADAGMSGILDAGGTTTVPLLDPSGTATIVETIGAPVVIERALAALSPEVLDILRREAGLLPVKADGEAGMSPEERTRRLVRDLSDRLGVDNSGRSYVIRVSFASTDPGVAASVANAVTEAYLGYRVALQREIYAGWLARATTETSELRAEMQAAERTAKDARERVRLLALRSETLLGAQQNDAIAQSADLYAAQREAERMADVVAQVYAGLLRTQRSIEMRLDWPVQDVRLFAPAVAPVSPSGPGIKPLLLVLGTIGGFLVGASLALVRSRRRPVSPPLSGPPPPGPPPPGPPPSGPSSSGPSSSGPSQSSASVSGPPA